MDRIDSVAVFAEVAERGSFSGAAKHLNRSAAAVTRAVAELETRLGVRLLNRTTRAVSVTEAGQRFLVGARRVLADLAEICLLYTSPSPRDRQKSRMPSSA